MDGVDQHLWNSSKYCVVHVFSNGPYPRLRESLTFDGIARACAEAAGAPEPELVHYNAKDFGKKKAFPMRDQHFFTSVTKAKEELDWEPRFVRAG